MLKKEILITRDGSKTLFIPAWNESYHSRHGAVQEAMHVFIQNGVEHWKNHQEVKILEYGFGTGLNTLLTLIFSMNTHTKIQYSSLEKFPLNWADISNINFENILYEKDKTWSINQIQSWFYDLHHASWNTKEKIVHTFELNKIRMDFKDVSFSNEEFNLVYFDAFGMRVQPELWQAEIFEKIFDFLQPQGLLTTYACNGKTVRILKSIGFEVHKIPGPPGKREMLNAWKR
ncbi:MAG: tRNA (5-methylaminomethyl-2-thiouridine)(34)-methyltransferase MnmD [Flavobacteriaceae bacterium]|nr:tRNA (5-methylaminomethyl-2-thiouridine)(34)-methyltransferase MnmD [Flavobacteriaceae bacterium]